MFYGTIDAGKARQKELVKIAGKSRQEHKRQASEYSLRERSQLMVAAALISTGKQLQCSVECKPQVVHMH